jgi:hypothetical protein
MQTTQIVRCPNCGSEAERHYFTSPDPTYTKCQEHQVTQTECPVCDYLMVMCSLTGNVIEAYAPGKSVQSISRTFERFRNIQVMEKSEMPINWLRVFPTG